MEARQVVDLAWHLMAVAAMVNDPSGSAKLFSDAPVARIVHWFGRPLKGRNRFGPGGGCF